MNLKSQLYRLLRWSEKYTKTDMVYLARGGFWLTTGKIVAALFSFLLAIAFAHFLPREIYGNYKYILSIGIVVGAFSLTGFGPAIIQAVSRGYEGTLRFAFWTNLKWSIAIILISLAGASYYFLNNNNTFALSFLIIGAFSPFLNSARFYGAYLNGKKEFRTLMTFGIISTSLQAVSLFLALLLTKNPVVLVFVYFFTTTTVNLALHFLTLKIYKPPDKVDPKIFNFSAHLSILDILHTVVGQLDKILIFHFLGGTSLAIYAFAQAPVVEFRSVLKLLHPLAIPKFSAQSKNETRKTLPLKMVKLSLMLIIPVVIYILLAPYLYRIFFPKYTDAIFFSQVFSLVLLFFPKKLAGTALLAHAEKKKLYTVTISALATRLVLLLILVPLFGILGAILAELGTHLISTVIVNHQLQRIQDKS
ncbi:oligosaccharide flippase family protein [Patescibacteria group bacterium]|nr:oligosaccharide flippase family protein [Patescibacteria group bacterium]